MAMLYCIAGLEVSPATARAPKVEPVNVNINRVLKGDRLPGAGAATRATPVKMQAPVTLPAGCEAIVSVITRSPLAQVAGNCVS
ncbi:hypothetical protein [Phenylobacterium sp.]|uniref:hypothetical protein n=1 Tax=Phenylobacterium sp. TaxID=1871053 RepID=UPI002F402326